MAESLEERSARLVAQLLKWAEEADAAGWHAYARTFREEAQYAAVGREPLEERERST